MSQQQIKQRNVISALQKHEICLLKSESNPKNVELELKGIIDPTMFLIVTRRVSIGKWNLNTDYQPNLCLD